MINVKILRGFFQFISEIAEISLKNIKFFMKINKILLKAFLKSSSDKQFSLLLIVSHQKIVSLSS